MVLCGETYLVAHDLLGLLVIEYGDCESARVFRVLREVEVAEVRDIAVQWVRGGVRSRQFFIGSYEAPALLRQMPMHRGKRDKVLETLELSCDQCPVRCGTLAIALTLSSESRIAYPKDKHKRHRDGNGPSQEGIPRRILWRSSFGTRTAGA